MHAIVVPRLNGNDDTCVLIEWMLADGDGVADQEAVAVVETAKATADVYSDTSGLIHPTVAPGTECRVGDVIGYVFADEAGRQQYAESAGVPPDRTAAAGPAVVLTDAARTLSERSGITDDQVRALGKRIVRESDIAALIEATEPRTPAHSARQRAIAQVVSRSHRSVPDGFVAMKVYCDELAERLRETNERTGSMIGIAEASITVLAGLRPSFPTFFSTIEDGERLVEPAEQINIGVTIDLGTGLFVPVLRDIGGCAAHEIAGQLMQLRVRVLRDAVRTDDLSDGQLSVSLNTDTDVLFAIPIVLAPQVCMISIGSTQAELALDEHGQVTRRSHLTVGMSYDHRVINGQDAVNFLTAFKSAVESAREVRL